MPAVKIVRKGGNCVRAPKKEQDELKSEVKQKNGEKRAARSKAKAKRVASGDQSCLNCG
jgi:hypothetical protein